MFRDDPQNGNTIVPELHSRPLVSIGLPVLNGARYLKTALDSLLAQDYPNFEIIISDNDSSDNTRQISEYYAANFFQITYTRCARGGVPSGENFNRVLSLCHGHYFMWATHNGQWDPRFISTCVSQFEGNANLVLVSSQMRSVDPNTGREMFLDHGISTIGLSRPDRVRRFLGSDLRLCGIFYGIYKKQVASDISLRIIIGTDHIFLCELALRGEFHTWPETLVSKNTGGSSATWGKIAANDWITNRFIIHYPLVAREWELQKLILARSGLSSFTRLTISLFSLYLLLKGVVWNRSKRLIHMMWCDIYHHLLPLLLRKPKPQGTGNPTLLPKAFGKWGRRN